MTTIARRLVPQLAWILALLGCLGLVTWDAVARIGRSLELSSHYDVAVRAPEADPDSLTGLALNRRSLLMPAAAPDTLHWIMQTQHMAARGDLRLRHVDYDNAPSGRAVHWAAPYRWWLLRLAHLDHVWLGTPLPLAIERAALWSGPAMFLLFLVGVVPCAARRFGVFAALALGAGLTGSATFAAQFAAGNADHHAPVAICALATVLLLIARPADPVAGLPRWHIASALAGAFGLWLSAATMIPVLIGIALGVGTAHGWKIVSRASGEPQPAATPWRWWGAVGGGATLLAYLTEYAPDNLSWRLEVIHPLYALAWFAGGELLCRLSGLRAGPPARITLRGGVIWSLAIGAAILPAVVIAALGTRVFLPADEFLRSLHGNYIAEFQSMARFLSGRAVDLDLVGRLAPLAMLVLALGFLARRSPTEAARQQLAVAAGPALVMLLLAIVQIRWWGLASGLGLLVVALAVHRAGAGKQRRVLAAGAMLLLAPGLVQAVRTATRAGTPTETDVHRLAERDVAHRLRLRVGAGPLVIAATPDETTSLIHFSGARGLGTLYWENRDGLRRAADLFSAATDEAAHELARSAGVTHVVLPSWDPGQHHLVRLVRHLPPDAPLPEDSLAARLQAGRHPSWLRPIAHRLPDHPLLRLESVRIHEVVAPRTPAQIAVDDAAYLLDMGRFEEAARSEVELARFPGDLPAQAMLAILQARRRDARTFGDTVRRISDLLPRAGTPTLETRLRVTSVLAIGGRGDLATTQLQAALVAADEASLRRLSPGEIADLLELADALGLAFPNAELRTLAQELDMRPRP